MTESNAGAACATLVILFTIAFAFIGFSAAQRKLEQACIRYAPTVRACQRL